MADPTRTAATKQARTARLEWKAAGRTRTTTGRRTSAAARTPSAPTNRPLQPRIPLRLRVRRAGVAGSGTRGRTAPGGEYPGRADPVRRTRESRRARCGGTRTGGRVADREERHPGSRIARARVPRPIFAWLIPSATSSAAPRAVVEESSQRSFTTWPDRAHLARVDHASPWRSRSIFRQWGLAERHTSGLASPSFRWAAAQENNLREALAFTLNGVWWSATRRWIRGGAGRKHAHRLRARSGRTTCVFDEATRSRPRFTTMQAASTASHSVVNVLLHEIETFPASISANWPLTWIRLRARIERKPLRDAHRESGADLAGPAHPRKTPCGGCRLQALGGILGRRDSERVLSSADATPSRPDDNKDHRATSFRAWRKWWPARR